MSAPVPRRDELDKGSGPRLRAGDRDGFCQLLRAHEQLIYKAAWSLTENQESAEQVAQVAVMMTWRDVEQCCGDASIRQKLAEKLIAAARTMQGETDSKRPDYSPQHFEPWRPISEKDATAAAFLDELHSALCALPYDCREAFVLRDMLSFTLVECVAVLQIETSLMKKLISNARLQFTMNSRRWPKRTYGSTLRGVASDEQSHELS